MCNHKTATILSLLQEVFFFLEMGVLNSQRLYWRGAGSIFCAICHGLQEFVLSESILDVNTSIEGVLLYMLEQALANGDKSWPELLKSFAWFPRVLFDLGPAKWDARWQ